MKISKEKIYDIVLIIFLVGSFILIREDTLKFWRYIYIIFIITTFSSIITKGKIIFTIEFFIKILFLIILIISTIFAIDVENSMDAILRFIRIIVFTFLLMNYIILYNKWILFVKGILIAGIILSIYIFYIYDFSIYDIYRVTTDGMNANVIGINISFSIWASLYLSNKYNKALPLFILPFLILIMLLTGSRKALIISIVSIVAFLMQVILKRNKKQILTIFIFIFLLFIFSDTIFEISIFDRISTFIDYLNGLTVTEESIFLRSKMIEYGIMFFSNKPIIGYGIDNYRFLISSTFYETYSHNNYIEILVGTGILGFFVYYVPMLSIFIISIKKNIKLFFKGLNIDNFYMIILLLNILLIDIAAVTYDVKVIQFMLAYGISFLYKRYKSINILGEWLNE